ncbi:hypothetical protein D3C76_862270 [compost metagenome]
MRLCPAQAFEQLRHQARSHGLQHADGQSTQRLALEVAHGLVGSLQAVEQRQGVVVQGVGGQGRQQALVAALEQAQVEAVLQLADLLGKRRLGQRQTLGGAAHVAFFIHRDEITQLAEIHKQHLSKMLEKRNGRKPS